MFRQQVEDCLKMGEVVLQSFAEDEDIIQVDHDEGIQVRIEHVVHGSLKRSWSICKSKGHH